ncbi:MULTISPECIES: SH3 domain-containing protein [unclassified Phenylobacterium]|uniref:SH3 domain-containing protein n=1 Tax=unclassified Phenylobacterium TaxID=2640670 RepID=UPI000B2EE5B1|nr:MULTISPECIES: SH3 domain-containing protein [unclassified Phenylobacterium]
MRPSQVTAAVVAVALALPAAATAQPTLRQGSPLSSIFGCDAGGNKQAGGAVIGGLVGGVVGSNLAKNERTLGAVLGAAAGAAAGSYIGCRMQRTDQQKAQAAAQYALDRGGSQSWSNAETGASGDVRVISTSNGGGGGQPVSLSGLRFANGVEPASAYEAASGPYTAPKTVNIRARPTTSAPVVGKLSGGQSFDALARVSGTPWLLAGRNGQAIGYVSDTVVRPASGGQYAGGNSVCRTFDQTIRTQSGAPETSRHTACKGSDGQWVVQG